MAGFIVRASRRLILESHASKYGIILKDSKLKKVFAFHKSINLFTLSPYFDSKPFSISTVFSTSESTTTSATTSNTASNLDVIQDEFKRQASVFEADWSKRSLRSTSDIMKWVMDAIGPIRDGSKALDVATGTGIFARALSEVGCTTVVGIDATKEMLDQARASTTTKSTTTPTYLQCDAAAIPFPDNSFDIVTCRLAVHHFSHPEIQIQEMGRVCKTGGKVVIVDFVTIGDEDTNAAEEHNRLEILRDPSHTKALTMSSLCDIVTSAGLKVPSHSDKKSQHVSTLEVMMDLDAWLISTCTPSVAAAEIRASINKEIFGGANAPRTGMFPTIQKQNDDGNSSEHILFKHTYAIVQAMK